MVRKIPVQLTLDKFLEYRSLEESICGFFGINSHFFE